MAAFDTPWMTSMNDPIASGNGGAHPSEQSDTNKPPTVATFSPNSQTFSSHGQRSTILVHQKSPLLLATPPQVTRALAYSHPFILPLNRLAGLLSWTTGDPWESFLLVASFWLTTLYGSYIIRWAGPVVLVTFLIVGMYMRRYSPLSSTGWTGEKQKVGHKRDPSDVSAINHHKSLDDMLSTLQTFTTRCNILLDPFLRLTDFLSTQQTATSATTQPALTTLFIRIMLASPFWWALAILPTPFRILTTKRIVLVFGTIILSWHSRPARISRTILWRSRTIRNMCKIVTGLQFGSPSAIPPRLPPRLTPQQSAIALANRRNGNEGIRFTFTLFENQRRWLGIGWTNSMLAYERATWTDEHLNQCPDPKHFPLPEVEGGLARWRWAEGSEWRVETGTKVKDTTGKDKQKEQESEEDAWVYYDNKWRDGRRGQDGWGRYTRRRKWVRDAELVDVDPVQVAEEEAKRNKENDALEQKHVNDMFETASNSATDTFAASGSPITHHSSSATIIPSSAASFTTGSSPGTGPSGKRQSWFANRSTNSRSRASSTSINGDGGSGGSSSGARSVSSSVLSRAAASGDGTVLTPIAVLKEREAEWGLGDDVNMVLG
ncbi:integral peroxisomal membrane peroxin-domain-containing protein [Delphinella strobiligena]|nr:integral peroxisomal membrane peroxin-domain-containing protein [Delphinella strobiligena]